MPRSRSPEMMCIWEEGGCSHDNLPGSWRSNTDRTGCQKSTCIEGEGVGIEGMEGGEQYNRAIRPYVDRSERGIILSLGQLEGEWARPNRSAALERPSCWVG